MGKRVFWFLLAWMVMVSLAGGGVNAQEPIVIKAVTYAPPNHISVDPVLIFIDKINALGKGRLKKVFGLGPGLVRAAILDQHVRRDEVPALRIMPFCDAGRRPAGDLVHGRL